MPQRLIKPAWAYVKSPISVRSMFAFFAVTFIAYTLINDQQQKQASIERFQAITAYMEESQRAIEEARKVGAESETTRQNTQQMLDILNSVDNHVTEMSDILKENNHVLRQKGNLTPTTRKKKVITGKPCYTIEQRANRIGDMLVTQDVFVPTECN